MRLLARRLALLSPALLAIPPAAAEAMPEFLLTLKGHRFDPAELQVPSGVRFQLSVRNADSTVAEFESTDLRVERIITAGRTTKLRLGPLEPGRYEFFEDFHSDVARGAVIAVKPSP